MRWRRSASTTSTDPGCRAHTPYAGVASLFRASLEQGQPAQVFEDGRQRRNFVHVNDVAGAVVAAAVADLPPGVTPLNIGSAASQHHR